MKHAFAVMIVLGLLIFPLLSIAEGKRNSGEFWRMEGMGKYEIIIGFREGLTLGFSLSEVSFKKKTGP